MIDSSDNPTMLGDNRLLRVDTLVDSEEQQHLRACNPSDERRTVTDTWNTEDQPLLWSRPCRTEWKQST